MAGGPPVADDQVVLTAPTDRRPGDTVVVSTVDGPRRFTVSGVVETAAGPALYVTGPTAARLARGRVAAVAVFAAPGTDPEALAGRVTATLSGRYPQLRVLTGAQRRSAEPDPDAGLLVATASLVGSTAGLAGFVCVIVVAGTFAFTVAQRRREFALLRTAGATPRQVRRLVLGEAALVGMVAGAAGCGLSPVLAPLFARWLVDNGLAPAGFTARPAWWPLLAAFGLGLLVAVAGAGTAARRAGRVRPIEALHAVTVELRGGTVVRWICGLGCLGGVVPMLPFLATPEGPAYLLVVVMLLVGGCALLLPVLVRPVGRLLTPGRGPVAVLARAGVRTERRRYASTIAPVLVTIGLAGGSLAGTGTISAAEAASLRAQLTAPLLVVPAGHARLPEPVARAVGAVPGVTAAARVKTTGVFDAGRNNTLRQRTAWYVDGPAAARVVRLPVAAGSLHDLAGATVAVSASMAGAAGWRVGDQAELWLGDGARASLRVVAILDDRLGLPDALLPWSLTSAHSGVPLPDSVYLGLAPGADRAGIEAAVAPLGGTVTETRTRLAVLDEEFDRLSRLSLLAILGMALVYTAISIANTSLMATTGRVRELLTLRLAGATRRQILGLVGREALTVGFAGAVFGALVTGATLLTVRIALGGHSDTVPIQVPWSVLLVAVAACSVTVYAASVAPAAVALRRRS
ncbi:ABC transporter permease [Plantactinospora mayteni]|uniref:ABC transporter permease n=1 Tax=Plantactinospora mayteni TaxID=566021 RepID=A0ABQ4F131_9ACTN|nr:ABC transporter permease [Plantactinospora mayteni]